MRNYTLTYTKASLNVTKATPAVSVANQTAKIGWGLDELTVPASANGVNGETVPGTFTWSETNGGTALGSDFTFSGSAGGTKTLYWTFTPADGTNYNTTSGSTVFTLKAKNAAALTLTAGKTSGVTYGDSVTYTAAVGKANSADTETFSGTLKLYLGSDATGTPLGESDAGSTLSVTLDKSNLTAGSHTVTAVYSGNRDYGSAAQSVTTSVAQSKIVAAADSKTMTAGGTLPAFTVSYTGIASGDTAASIFSAAAAAACKADGKTAGSYDITVTAPVLTAAAAANYTVGTPVSGKLTVSAAPSSSSGSSGGGTTAPSVNQSEKSVVIDAGNSSVSDSQIQSALETAKKNNFSTISIVSTAASGSVSLSASAVGYLVSGGTQLSLETKNGGIVSVAPAVFQGLGLKASDQVSVGMTDAGTVNGVKTFTVDLSVNGTAVHDLNGAVGLDFPVDTAWNGKAAVIAHTHASGAVTYAGAVVKDGLAAVNVTDLSTFKVELASALPAAAFSDVKPEDWCFGGIEYAVEQGFLKGTSATTFSPNASLTRGQLVTVLWRMAGSPAMDDYGYPYEDVNALTNAFAPAVYWARAQGIANGYSDEKFAPNAAVNREQLAAILYRYAQYKKYDVSVGEDTNILSYTDAFRVSEYAIPALQWACGAGVIQGSGNALMPFGTATRAQAAVILQRFCQNTAKK
jgi:S-layer homology domain.